MDEVGVVYFWVAFLGVALFSVAGLAIAVATRSLPTRDFLLDETSDLAPRVGVSCILLVLVVSLLRRAPTDAWPGLIFAAAMPPALFAKVVPRVARLLGLEERAGGRDVEARTVLVLDVMHVALCAALALHGPIAI